MIVWEEKKKNPENKGSEQLKRKKYANDINRQSTKEKKMQIKSCITS